MKNNLLLVMSLGLLGLAGCGTAIVGNGNDDGGTDGGPACPAGQTECGSACADVSSDRMNCGGCGNVCLSGEVCSVGACGISCGGSTPTLCGAACVNTMIDAASCGDCGTACGDGEVCSGGSCQQSCGGSTPTLCGDACVNTDTDRANCGGCGTACGDGEVCSGGTCQLSCGGSTPTLCGDACVNTMIDRNHCGGCAGAGGNPCGTGQVCSSGTCQATCGGSTPTACGDGCSNTDTDRANCGGCGNACASGEVCSGGTCGPTCGGSTPTLCTDACVNTDTDEANCGGCGNACASGDVCTAGTCTQVCGGSTATLCGDACVDTLTNRSHCGDCATVCGDGEVCVAGTCTLSCGAGLTNCSGMCTSTDYDPANCGACGTACGPGEACFSGTCQPLRGFSGATGSTWEPVAPSTTGRGLQAWVRSGSPYMYAGSSTSFVRQDLSTGMWVTLASPPSDLAGWGSPAAAAGAIWEIRPPNVYRYDPMADAWSTPPTTLPTGDDHSMTVTDDAGNLWGYTSTSEQLIRYDVAAGTAALFPTGVTTNTYETRLGYDGFTDSIYFGGYGAPNLYRLDIASGAVTELTPIPESMLNDIFCADRSGHIYAAGGSSGSTLLAVHDRDRHLGADPRLPDRPRQQRLVLGAPGRLALHRARHAHHDLSFAAALTQSAARP